MPISSFLTEILRSSDPDELAQALEAIDSIRAGPVEGAVETEVEASTAAVASSSAVPEVEAMPARATVPGRLQ